MKRVLLLLGIMFSVLSASADENVLQTIEIEPVKDTYNIVLVSDKAVDVKKTIQASNKITLSMKDIRVSKTLNTKAAVNPKKVVFTTAFEILKVLYF